MNEERDPDERVSIPLPPEEALRAMLKIDPDAEPVEDDADNRDAPDQPDERNS